MTATDFNLTHCESCGTNDVSTDRDGYTTCCNELVCYGGYSQDRFAYGPFGTMDVKGSVTACCGAQADKIIPAEFDRLYRM